METRSIKDGNFHWANNAILDDYGRLLGSDALAVYYALCRFANNRTQRCWPSIPKIQEKIGLSRPTIIKALRKLENLRLVQIERTLGGNNHYRLLAVPPVNGVAYPVNGLYPKTRRNNKTRSLDSTIPQSPTKITRVDFVLVG